MALNYIYLKYKDTYTLKNNGVVDLTYHISTVTCEATTEIKTGVIIPNQTVVLSFATDNVYSVYLNSSTETDPPFTIKYYNNLLTSFISMVEQITCGCGQCKECEECNQCEDYLSTFMKAQAFNTVNYPVYQGYVNQITQDSICLYSQEILCSLLHEKVYGKVETKDTMLTIIGSYYLSFYYQDKFLAVDQEEKDFITAKYKFDKIGSCIRKIGITPTDPLYMTTTTTTSTTTQPPTTSSTTTTTLNPCLIEGTAILFTGTTSTSTTTQPTTTSTSTSTSTVPPTTSTTTSTTTVPPTTSTSTTSTTTYSGTVYTHGFSAAGDDNNLACANTTVVNTFYSSSPTVIFGSILYVDSGLTTRVNGNDKWYKHIVQGNAPRINTNGQVFGLASCS